MVPDQVYAITIELFPVANLLCRRHRLSFENIERQFPHLRSTRILASRKAVTAASYHAQSPLRRGSPPHAGPVIGQSRPEGWRHRHDLP
jgi:hypothetical protein